jgi:LPS export ABC transporter protein LptC
MKTGRKKVIIVALLTAVLVLAAVLAVRMIGKAPGKALLKIMSDRVDLQVRNIRYTEVGDSDMTWEITAEAARYQKKENLAVFDRVAVRLVMKDGATFVMTGDRGRFDTASRDMELEGNVVIVSENGDRFTTDHLRYRNAGKRIETDGLVVMESRSVKVSGVGMIFSLEGRKVALLSQVRANSAGR